MPLLRTVLAAALLSSSALPAQRVELASIATSPELSAGTLVRVRNASWRLSGRLIAASGDTLILRGSPIPVRYRAPVFLTSEVLVSTGHASRVRGAFLGAGAGVLGSVLVGLLITEAFDASPKHAFELAPYFFPYLIPAGAVTGIVFPGHRWARVELTPR